MSENNASDLKNSLRHCDREPVHIPGRVQAYGVLLAFDPETHTVLQAGGCVMKLLGVELESVLQTPVYDLFDQESRDKLRKLLETARERPNAICHLTPASAADKPLAATLHLRDSVAILELEDVDLAPSVPASSLQLFCAEVQERLNKAPSLNELWQSAVDAVRELTGFDRVMLYMFHQDFSGEVVAEAMIPRLQPFLGHRYPATDIPEPARNLYLKNWLRLIPDVHVQQTPLMPEGGPGNLAHLDMSHARLRAVSPIHIEYLKNMGVTSSLSLTVLVEGRLWGLIACHHYDGPLFFSLEVQRTMILLTRCFSSTLAVMLSQRAYQDRLAKEELVKDLQDKIAGVEPLDELVLRIAPDLMQLVNSEGLALATEGAVTVAGDAPPEACILTVASWLSRSVQDTVHATRELCAVLPECQDWKKTAAGILALRLGGFRNTFLIWFRPEIIVEELWGGDPTRPYTLNPESGAINPRTSFETFRREVTGRSEDWTRHDIYAAHSLIPLFNAHLIRIAETVLKRNEKRFRELVTYNPDAQLVFSENHEALFFNPAAKRFLDASPDSIAILSEFTRSEQAELSLPMGENLIWAEVRSSEVEWEGQPAHLVSLRDITERKQMEQLKDDVQRITQHDLISPLNPVINLPLLLADDENINDDQKEMLAAISKAGQRVRQIIELSLNLYKMEQGVYAFLPTEVDLLQTFRDILADQSSHLRQHKVSVRILLNGKEVDAQSSFMVLADPILCYSMFSNLLLNSIEASGSNDVVTLNLHRNGIGEISIHNTGVVPAAIQEKFFEKYVTHGKSRGTGLGTYSARLIARTLGGGIAMHSAPEHGTTVTVSLPLPDKAALQPETQQALLPSSKEIREGSFSTRDSAQKAALKRLYHEVSVSAFGALKTAKKTALLFDPDSAEQQNMAQIIASLTAFDYPTARQLLEQLLQKIGETL